MKYTFKKTGHYLIDDDGDKAYEYFFYFEDGVEFTYYMYEDPNPESEESIQNKYRGEREGSCHTGMTCEQQADWYRRSLGLEYH